VDKDSYVKYLALIGIGLALIGILITIITQKPEDWANNIASWNTFLLIIAILVFAFLLSFYTYKQFFNKGYTIAFKNRDDPKLKNLLAKELDNTKNISVIGFACDEISKKTDDFWKLFLVDRDGILRMIFIDPNGEQAHLREHMVFGDSDNRFSKSVKGNISRLFVTIDRIKDDNIPKTLRTEIRTNDFAPVVNCIITDNCVFIHHYGSNTRGVNMPIYVVRKGSNKVNNQIYEFYKDTMFNDLWGKSSPCNKEDCLVKKSTNKD